MKTKSMHGQLRMILALTPLFLTSTISAQSWNRDVIVAGDGVSEVGKYIDFHEADSDPGVDFNVRLFSNNNTLSTYSNYHTISDMIAEGNVSARTLLRVGKFSDNASIPGMDISYIDGGSGTTTFWGNRWGQTFVWGHSISGGGKNMMTLDDWKLNVNGDVQANKVIGLSNAHFRTILGVGQLADNASVAGMNISYVDDGSGTTTFWGSRWGQTYVWGHSNGAGGRQMMVLDDWELTVDGNIVVNNPSNPTLDFVSNDNSMVNRGLGRSLHFTEGYNSTQLFLETGGNIGIGTTTPSEKLSVNGTIRSKEIKVEASPWPDYVFEEDYPLIPLSELEAFVMENHHLPEVPTEAEVTENGVELGATVNLLLKKIEELTLYTIEQQKEIEVLKTKIENIEK